MHVQPNFTISRLFSRAFRSFFVLNRLSYTLRIFPSMLVVALNAIHGYFRILSSISDRQKNMTNLSSKRLSQHVKSNKNNIIAVGFC